MNKRIHILLVEDNEGDILLTTEALEESKMAGRISVVRDGEEAIHFIFKKGKYKNEESPGLILLDINLPKKSGHEVLGLVKSNKDTRHIPVIMLTTSSSRRDIDLAYEHHANCFITKPLEVEDFMKVMQVVESFWMNVIQLPRVAGS